jgi:hypothetical protein
MAKALSQTQAQKIILENGFQASTGSESFSVIDAKEIGKLLLARGDVFKDEWIRVVNEKNIVASGDIERNLTFYLDTEPEVATLYIEFAKYAKFVDRGVKGVAKLPNGKANPFKDRNAPDSPYQYKNYGMSADGRASLKKWLSTAKAKVSSRDVKKYGAVRTEKKFKKISEADSKLNTLIYNIKRFGIKKRNFITPIVEKSFQGFEQELAEAIGKKVSIVILA